MIKRTYDSRYQPITMEVRYANIMDVLKNSNKPLSSTEIAAKYIELPKASDSLVTGQILNVLTLASIVKKTFTMKGKSVRYKYELFK